MRVVRRAAALTQGVGGLTGGNRGGCGPAIRRGEATGGAGSNATFTGGNRENRGGRESAEGEFVDVEGGNVLMRSVLIDAISQVTNFGGSAVAPGAMADSPTSARAAGAREIAQLANAWARLNAGKMEEEKLKLRTEDLRQAAFDEIGRDVRGNAEAMELFEKLREVMTREKEGKAVASSK